MKYKRLLTFAHDLNTWLANSGGMGVWEPVRADVARSLACKGWIVLDAA